MLTRSTIRAMLTGKSTGKGKGSDANDLAETAVLLLLRSPRFAVGEILELLDMDEREFREIAKRNRRINELLEERRLGQLKPLDKEPRQCLQCREWFVPYGADRFCSDECKKAGQLGLDKR